MPEKQPTDQGQADPHEIRAASCRFLGTDQDADVCYSFANRLNHCYRKEPHFPVALSHQDQYCLTARHVHCELYQNGENPKKVHPEIAAAPRKPSQTFDLKTTLLFSLGIMAIVVIFSLAFLNHYGYLGLGRSTTEPTGSKAAPTLAAAGLPSPTPGEPFNLFFLFNSAPTSTAAQTTTAADGSQPLPTPGPEFGTPFGQTTRYILHRVAMGESFHYLANLYDTSVEAIQVLNNLHEGNPIGLDQVIVVQPGIKDSEELPRFSLVQLEGDTQLELIAEHYGLSMEHLKEINDLGEISLIPAGRWLLIPIRE